MSTPDLSSLIFCGDGECDHPAWMNEDRQAWGKLLKEWEGTYTEQFARPAEASALQPYRTAEQRAGEAPYVKASWLISELNDEVIATQRSSIKGLELVPYKVCGKSRMVFARRHVRQT